jgi:pilus assembly protein Flp/PilA
MSILVRQFLCDEEGITAIEYSLLAALIALAIIAGATTLGLDLNSAFSTVGSTVASVMPAS